MRRAMVIVGVQNDFCPGGAAAVAHGDEVAGPLSFLANTVDHAGGLVVAVREWHSDRSGYFTGQGGDLRPFCVAGTQGAAFHRDLHLSRRARFVFRNGDPREVGPSAFRAVDRHGASLAELLANEHVGHLFLGGIATEREIQATALDALRRGLEVSVVQDGIAPLDVRAGLETLTRVRLAGAEVVSSGQAIMALYSAGEARF
ncbi:isochorismatase family protein [Vulgatibacter sp.]|uniref:isochorismatase family protein n=1 Tax=Vulgatibacter sp. TaxID=1971226 RepID=UPI0035661213